MGDEAREVARDEAGRFAKSEVVELVEEPADEPVEEVVEAVKLLGKFDSVSDLEKAYGELERKQSEPSRDVSEMHRLEAELQALRHQINQPAQPQYDTDALEEWFDDNPGLVAQTVSDAHHREDWTLYHAAMERWYEMSPRQASAYERNTEIALLRWEMDSKITETTRPLAVQTQTQEFNQALRNLSVDFPEIVNEKFAVAMMAEASRFPVILNVLHKGDLASKEEAMRSLALMTRGRNSDNLVSAAKESARTEQASASEAKRAAAVLTGSSSPTREVPSNIDAFREAFRGSAEFRKAAGLPRE